MSCSIYSSENEFDALCDLHCKILMYHSINWNFGCSSNISFSLESYMEYSCQFCSHVFQRVRVFHCILHCIC